ESLLPPDERPLQELAAGRKIALSWPAAATARALQLEVRACLGVAPDCARQIASSAIRFEEGAVHATLPAALDLQTGTVALAFAADFPERGRLARGDAKVSVGVRALRLASFATAGRPAPSRPPGRAWERPVLARPALGASAPLSDLRATSRFRIERIYAAGP